MSIGSATDIAGKNVAPYLTAVVPDHRAGADTSRPRLAYEDVRRQDRGREVVRRVDDLTDTEVDGDAPDRVGLLPRVAVLVHQVVEHVPQGVARRGREVVGGPARRGVGAEAGRRERRARRGVRGRDGDLEPHVAQPALGGLARADVEARSEDRANLYRGPGRRPPPHGADERRPGDPPARKVRRGPPAVGELPPDEERLWELVGEEPEPGDLGRVPERGRHDLEDLAGEDVAGPGPFDADRPGERMHDRAVAP